MAIYTPIEVNTAFECSRSDMIDLRWSKDHTRPTDCAAVSADFLVPNDYSHALRVQFDLAVVVRVLDEMLLSTENEATPNVGLKSEHFAYKVEGASFWFSLSEALRVINPSLQHYRFITGWACLDVIAMDEPKFTTIPLSTNANEPHQHSSE